MGFVVMALGTIASGIVMRRDPESGLTPPITEALKTLAIPVVITIACVELAFMQEFMPTVSLSAGEWLTCIALALVLPVVVELHKAFIRSRGGRPLIAFSAEEAVSPKRARTSTSA
jgi:Ca2+-transporting ATPase